MPLPCLLFLVPLWYHVTLLQCLSVHIVHHTEGKTEVSKCFTKKENVHCFSILKNMQICYIVRCWSNMIELAHTIWWELVILSEISWNKTVGLFGQHTIGIFTQSAALWESPRCRESVWEWTDLTWASAKLAEEKQIYLSKYGHTEATEGVEVQLCHAL